MTVQLPNDSTEYSFFATTLCFAILLEAIVNAIVNASGNPSGIADTDNAITDNNISSAGRLFPAKIMAITIPANTIITVISFENFSTRIVNGDFSSFVLLIVVAITPISVFLPISTTIALARPVVTEVPANNIFDCDVIGIFSFCNVL